MWVGVGRVWITTLLGPRWIDRSSCRLEKVSPMKSFRQGYRRTWVVRAAEKPMSTTIAARFCLAVIKRTAMQQPRQEPVIQKWTPAAEKIKRKRGNLPADLGSSAAPFELPLQSSDCVTTASTPIVRAASKDEKVPSGTNNCNDLTIKGGGRAHLRAAHSDVPVSILHDAERTRRSGRTTSDRKSLLPHDQWRWDVPVSILQPAAIKHDSGTGTRFLSAKRQSE